MPPNPLFQSHPRAFGRFRYVYPVVSRRAGGISLGINLNRDRFCNFNCVYCQVDRTQPGTAEPVDLKQLDRELDAVAEQFSSGALFQEPPFSRVPPELRRLNDAAFSGDGEPTASPLFGPAVAVAAEVRRRRRLDALKLVLITNASLLHQEPVRQALDLLDRNHGEIWAKLDAGTEAYYRQVARSAVPFQRILTNLRDAARARPIVIQSLFPQMHGLPPPPEEIPAYCRRLGEILAAGGKIQTVQIYTVARAPADFWVTPLPDADLDRIAETVRRETGVDATAYYGYAVEK
ncbi:MAG: radical SAM protein [Pirellulales bacterium]|nr:radical SAM protein [Pirellulales bacterium]